MAMIACSLHPMDVQLLKTVITALQGGTLPDFKAEVARRVRRDILLNWSRKIIHAAAPLADAVPPDRWLLYTQLRPVFITTDNPEQAVFLVDRFFSAQTLDDVLNMFLEEVARIDPDRAGDIIELARQDRDPGVITFQSAEEISANLRGYLLYERRQLEQLLAIAADTAIAPAQLQEAGRWLAWRTCGLLANFRPSWSVHTCSLTMLVSRRDLGVEALVADPRGMYTEIAQRVPGLHPQIPYYLQGDKQTGMCLAPKAVPAMLELLAGWPQPLPTHPTLGAPTPADVQALQEALLYAQRQGTGLWEAAGMVVPEHDIYPIIVADQCEREEHPDQVAHKEDVEELTSIDLSVETPVSVPAARKPQATIIDDEFAKRWERTQPVKTADDTTKTEGETNKTPWFKKIIKH